MAKDEIKKVVVIGGSAGSLEKVLEMLPKLPVRAGFVYILVAHRRFHTGSSMEDLVRYRTKIKVVEVEDKEPILTNHIYIAPADYHLLVEKAGHFSLDNSEKIHYSRPSIDVSFDSVAEVYGDKTLAILLSGANEDGAAGLQRVVALGGEAWIQDPATAEFPQMPLKAQQLVRKAEVMDIPSMIQKLLDLAQLS